MSDPQPAFWRQLALADLNLDKGDPVAAQALLAQVPLDFSPTEHIWDIRFTAALYLRDYDAANRVIAATPAKFADRFPFRWIASADGLVAVARGDKQKAQSIFLDARKRLDATWGTKVKDELYFSLVAELDAGLGRKEDAIREALRAVTGHGERRERDDRSAIALAPEPRGRARRRAPPCQSPAPLCRAHS